MFDFEDLPKEFDLKPLLVDENTPGFVKIGDLGATVHNRPEGKAPIAVVLVPGNPGIQGLVKTGVYHAQAKNMLHIRDELEKAGFPCLSFDWPGIGMSAVGGPTDDVGKWKAPEAGIDEFFFKCVTAAVEWARENLSDNIVACGWNIGGYYAGAKSLEKEGFLQGFVSVSLAYNVYLQYLMTEDPVMVAAGNQVKKTYDDLLGKVKCKSLFVVGNMDTMTPVHKMKPLIQARPDKGANIEIRVIDQKGTTGLTKEDYFRMVGWEKDVGLACAAFVQALQGDMDAAPAKSIGA
mmetsp:Transcript_137085/g.292792  ORF Transcript_137085/g.292792 Transcript_137085/m.292792 type:complete len:292 (+) Transcript_137085:30-905(+)